MKSKPRAKGKQATAEDAISDDNERPNEAVGDPGEVVRTRVKKKARSRANSDDEVRSL